MSEIKQILEALTSEGSTEAVQDLTKSLRELLEVQTKLGITYRDLSESGRDVTRALEAGETSASSFADKAFGLGEKIGSLGGLLKENENGIMSNARGFLEMATGGENAAASMANLTAGFKSAINPAKLLSAGAEVMIEAMVALAFATDVVFTQFNRSTGALDMFGNQMISLQRDLSPLSVGVKDITEAYGGLINNFGGFNRLSGIQQESLAKNTAVLSELGVSATTTAATYNTLMSAFAMTEAEASSLQREMFVLAQEIGMPPQAMAEGFQQALPQLAAFGTKSSDVYKKLAVNAKAAGMEVQSLLSITQQFDTFEGAAQAVGKLNALLGGPYLSTTKMIKNTDPTERMRMLSSAINDAGKSFDQMEYYERKATAAAMGLADVSELALVMNNRFDLLEPQTKQSASDLEKLAEQTAKFNSVTEVLTGMLTSLVANLEPVIRGFKGFLGGIASFMAAYPSFKVALMAIPVALLAIGVSMSFITGPVGAVIAVISALVVMMGLAYSYIGSFSDILNETSGSAMLLKTILMAWMGQFFLPFMYIGGFIYGMFAKYKEIFDELATSLEPLRKQLEPIFKSIAKDLVPVLQKIGEHIMMLGGFVGGLLVEVTGIRLAFRAFGAIIKAIAPLIVKFFKFIADLASALNDLYTMIQIGNSPSFIEVLGLFGNAFRAMGDAITAPIRAVQSLFGIMKDFIGYLLSPEVMDILGKVFDQGVAVVSRVFGVETNTQTDQIAQARMEIESAMVDSNNALKKSIDQLTKAMVDNNKGDNAPVININGNLDKIFDIQEKRMERKMSARPVFSTTGGR
jgi:hypothetical protein